MERLVDITLVVPRWGGSILWNVFLILLLLSLVGGVYTMERLVDIALVVPRWRGLYCRMFTCYRSCCPPVGEGLYYRMFN